jgi:hypothetical protein
LLETDRRERETIERASTLVKEDHPVAPLGERSWMDHGRWKRGSSLSIVGEEDEDDAN